MDLYLYVVRCQNLHSVLCVKCVIYMFVKAHIQGFSVLNFYPPSQKGGVYYFAHVGLLRQYPLALCATDNSWTLCSKSFKLGQVEISTHLLTFSLLFGKILLCCPKIIPVRRDILMWISFHVWLHFNHTLWAFICEQYKWYLFKYYVMLLIWSTVLSQVWRMFYSCYKTLELVLKLLGIISLASFYTRFKFSLMYMRKVWCSYHCWFYIDNFIFALFIF